MYNQSYSVDKGDINEEKNNIGAIFPPQNKVASTGVFRKEGEEKYYKPIIEKETLQTGCFF